MTQAVMQATFTSQLEYRVIIAGKLACLDGQTYKSTRLMMGCCRPTSMEAAKTCYDGAHFTGTSYNTTACKGLQLSETDSWHTARAQNKHKLTFQATGCPNPNPYVDYWKTVDDATSFSDMHAYCTVNQGNSASAAQQAQCCGSSACSPASCTLQTQFTEHEDPEFGSCSWLFTAM